MSVRIDAKKTKLSDATKQHVHDACDKLSHFHDRIIDVDVIIDTQAKHKPSNSVEIIVKVPGQRLIGKGETDEPNLFKAIDEAAGHVERQLKRHHDKHLAKQQAKKGAKHADKQSDLHQP